MEDRSRIAEARRTAAELGSEQQFGPEDQSRLALVVTELSTNLLAHAGEGELLMRGLFDDFGGRQGVEVLSLDRGPGLGALAEAVRDGFSTQATPGTGLGAVVRAAQDFDVHTQTGVGTVVVARVCAAARSAPPVFSSGVVNVTHPDEEVCGDSWLIEHQADRTLLLVADGLGHGPQAARASRAAVARATGRSERPDVLLDEVHEALRGTRGAAVGIAAVDRTGAVRFVGVGNVASSVVEGLRPSRGFVSKPGIVGLRMPALFTDPKPAQPGSLLVMHSDGLRTDWSIGDHPGLFERDPAVVAGLLFRDHARADDDVTVVVDRLDGVRR